MAKKQYPEYHKALSEQSAYPSALRRIKFEETERCYFYKTGAFVYKIRKTSSTYPTVAIKERFAREALRLGRLWAPEVVHDVVPIVRTDDGGYALGDHGTVVDYALRMTQLSDHYWLYRLLPAGRLTATTVGRLARFLAEHHQASPAGERGAEVSRPEHYHALAEEIFYQSTKFLDVTLNQSVLDMVIRPVHRFIDEGRKMLLRRHKRGRVVDGHGAFIPEHLFVHGQEVCAIAPLDAQPKFRVLDAANDVSTLLNALALAQADEWAELFLKRYISASHDRELPYMLPAFQALHAMRGGLRCSQRMTDLDAADERRNELAAQAGAYFHLAVQSARQIGRSA